MSAKCGHLRLRLWSGPGRSSRVEPGEIKKASMHDSQLETSHTQGVRSAVPRGVTSDTDHMSKMRVKVTDLFLSAVSYTTSTLRKFNMPDKVRRSSTSSNFWLMPSLNRLGHRSCSWPGRSSPRSGCPSSFQPGSCQAPHWQDLPVFCCGATTSTSLWRPSDRPPLPQGKNERISTDRWHDGTPLGCRRWALYPPSSSYP